MLVQIPESEKFKSGVVSYVEPDEASALKLRPVFDLAQELFPRTECMDGHVTVAYSENQARVQAIPHTSGPFKATVTQFICWTGHDGKLYIVASLKSPDLELAHGEWVRLGYTTYFSTYRPHFTVVSDCPSDKVEALLVALNTYLASNPLELIYGNEVIRPLEGY